MIEEKKKRGHFRNLLCTEIEISEGKNRWVESNAIFNKLIS